MGSASTLLSDRLQPACALKAVGAVAKVRRTLLGLPTEKCQGRSESGLPVAPTQRQREGSEHANCRNLCRREPNPRLPPLAHLHATALCCQ